MHLVFKVSFAFNVVVEIIFIISKLVFTVFYYFCCVLPEFDPLKNKRCWNQSLVLFNLLLCFLHQLVVWSYPSPTEKWRLFPARELSLVKFDSFRVEKPSVTAIDSKLHVMTFPFSFSSSQCEFKVDINSNLWTL